MLLPSVPAAHTLPAYLTGGIYGLNCAPTGGCTNSQVWPTAPTLTQLLDSRQLDPDGAGPLPPGAAGSGANAPWSMASFTTYAGKRTTDNDVQTYQFLAGFEGELANRDMTWEAYLSHGSTDVSTLFGGVISIERYRYLVNLPNYGRNAFYQGNHFSAAHIAGGTLSCETGLPIAESFTPSEDCIDAIVADLQSTSEMDQTIAEVNVQGKLVDLWAGEARFAAGVSTRENSYFYIQDPLGEPDVVPRRRCRHLPGRQLGRRDVDVRNLRRAAAAAGRPTSASSTSSISSSATGTPTTIPPRPSRPTRRCSTGASTTTCGCAAAGNIANRAPNIGELFEAKTQIVGAGGSTLGDLCNPTNTAGGGLSANPALNPNAAQVRAMCEAQMGVTGATAYYAPGNNPGASTLGNRTGNPNLHSEDGETMTIGAVLNFAERTSITVDAYEITITDYIAAQLGESVFRTCYDPAFNPTYSPFTPACEQILRDPTNGQIGAVDVTYSNSSVGRDERRRPPVRLGHGPRAAAISDLNFLASYPRQHEDEAGADRGVERVEGHVRTGRLVGLERGRIRLPHVHDRELLQERLEPLAALAAFADDQAVGDRVESGDDDHHARRRTTRSICRAASRSRRAGSCATASTTCSTSSRCSRTRRAFTRGTATNGGFYDVLGRRAYVGLSVSF